MLIFSLGAAQAGGALAAGNPVAISKGPVSLSKVPVVSTKGPVPVHTGIHSSLATLHDQTAGYSGIATLSQNFSDFPTDSSQIADDFVVPSATQWTLSEVGVLGQYFNGSGPADSVSVFLYDDSGSGSPGTLIHSYPNLTPSNGLATGSFNIPVKSTTLGSGTYWVSVQANMAFIPGGEWGWNDVVPQSNNGAYFQNPGGALVPTCTTWMPRTTCADDAAAPDQAFALFGSSAASPSLYDQTGSPGAAITNSQDITDLPTFTDQAADDFIVPAGKQWTINQVNVLGQYSAGTFGPADSVNVYFYPDNGYSHPGNGGVPAATPTYTYTGLQPSNGITSGNFNIPIPNTALGNGHWWVSVQAVMPYNPNGLWNWVDSIPTANSPAAWQNPGNGWGYNCTTWTTRDTCGAMGTGAPDQAFAVFGVQSDINDLGVTGGYTFNAVEGHDKTGIVAHASDPDNSAAAHDWTVSINWGDGSAPTTCTTTGGTACTYSTGSAPGSDGTIQLINCTATHSECDVQGSHTYVEDGTYTITVTVNDVDQTTQPAPVASTAAVADAPLIISGFYTYTVPPLTSTGSIIVATFVDTANNATSCANTTYTATINWGDGTPLGSGSITQTGTCAYTIRGTHTYIAPGTYFVNVTAIDDGGATSTGHTATITVAYPPATPPLTPAQRALAGQSTTTPPGYTVGISIGQPSTNTYTGGIPMYIDSGAGFSLLGCYMVNFQLGQCRLSVKSVTRTCGSPATETIYATYTPPGSSTARQLKIVLVAGANGTGTVQVTAEKPTGGIYTGPTIHANVQVSC